MDFPAWTHRPGETAIGLAVRMTPERDGTVTGTVRATAVWSRQSFGRYRAAVPDGSHIRAGMHSDRRLVAAVGAKLVPASSPIKVMRNASFCRRDLLDSERGHQAHDPLWSAVAKELDRYYQLSPLVRGPKELSHSLVRLVAGDEFGAAISSMPPQTEAARDCLDRFVRFALVQDASDRGRRYLDNKNSLGGLTDQIMIWGKELSMRRLDAHAARIKVQVALSEELAANLAPACN